MEDTMIIWITTPAFTCVVWAGQESAKITDTAPILKRFRGRELHELYKWVTKKFGSDNVHWEKLVL